MRAGPIQTTAVPIDIGAITAEVESRLKRQQPDLPRPTQAPLLGTRNDAGIQAAADQPLPSREESRKQLFEEFARDLQAHESDARDATWARGAESSITEVLANRPGSNYQVLSVDCRTTSCIAKLGWTSRKEALTGFQTALNATFKPNCAAKILLHDADSEDAPFQENLILDCTEARAE